MRTLKERAEAEVYVSPPVWESEAAGFRGVGRVIANLSSPR